MKRGNEYRAYPDRAQATILSRWIGCQRFVYNAKTQEDRYYRRFASRLVGNAGQHAPIDQEYARFIGPDTAFLREVPSQVLRNGAVRWMQAYSRFFKKLAGRPTIKKKHGRQAVWLTSELFRFEPIEANDNEGAQSERQWRLIIGTKKVPVGELRYKAHAEHARPNSIGISVEAGQWFVSFTDEDNQSEYNDEDIREWLEGFGRDELMERTTGCDRGVAVPLMTNEGEAFDFSGAEKRAMNRRYRRVKRFQRQMARQRKGSQRRERAKRRIARLQQANRRTRKDFAHKVSHDLVSDPTTALIAMEDLKVKNMTRSAKGTVAEPGKKVAQKSGLNRSILNSAWGFVRTFTTYKARQRHQLLLLINPAHTSQECSKCGHLSPDNRQNQAEFVCQRCGFCCNADVNAAVNIKRRAVDAILSGASQQKATKKTMRMRKKVRQGLSDPAADTIQPPKLVEEVLDVAALQPSAQFPVKRETLTIAIAA